MGDVIEFRKKQPRAIVIDVRIDGNSRDAFYQVERLKKLLSAVGRQIHADGRSRHRNVFWDSRFSGFPVLQAPSGAAKPFGGSVLTEVEPFAPLS
jgi:hypothetical protein